MEATDPPAAEPVLLRRDGAVAVLQLNRPAAFNALDVPTATAFLAACRQLAAAGDVRAVVLSGAGRSFGVGGDLAAMRDEGAAVVAPKLIDALHAAVQILAALDAPVLASLQGAVAGGSMSLALAADLAIAAENASFNLAYTRIGASCDLSSSWHLPRLVGLRRAMEIALLSDTIDAAEALRLGLVNRVVATERLEEETMALGASPRRGADPGLRAPQAAAAPLVRERPRRPARRRARGVLRQHRHAPISPRAWPPSSAAGSPASKVAEPAAYHSWPAACPRGRRFSIGAMSRSTMLKNLIRGGARALLAILALGRLHPRPRAPPIRRWSSASSMSRRSARPAGPTSTSSAGAPSSVPSARG